MHPITKSGEMYLLGAGDSSSYARWPEEQSLGKEELNASVSTGHSAPSDKVLDKVVLPHLE